MCPVAVYGCASSAWLGAVMEGMVEEANEAWWRRCDWPGISATAAVSVAEATLLHGINNARSESANTKIRLIARRAFGFHSAKALIALSELTLGGLCPSLPGRL